jgi:hypothetical protein
MIPTVSSVEPVSQIEMQSTTSFTLFKQRSMMRDSFLTIIVRQSLGFRNCFTDAKEGLICSLLCSKGCIAASAKEKTSKNRTQFFMNFDIFHLIEEQFTEQ